MMDFLKKAFKPIATVSGILLGIGIAALFSDTENIVDKLNLDLDRTGPWRNPDIQKDESGHVILTADTLRQLRWMSTSQLKAIFKGRKDYYRIENTPAAYQELRWMSTSQLEAIFGTKDI